MAITNAQQYKQILQKEREEKAFGGLMGIDGRKAYVGGSYSGKDPEGGNQGAGQYQGGSGAPGSAESIGGGGDGPDPADPFFQKRPKDQPATIITPDNSNNKAPFKFPSTIGLARSGINFIDRKRLDRNRIDYLKKIGFKVIEEEDGSISFVDPKGLSTDLQNLANKGKLYTDEALKEIQKMSGTEGIQDQSNMPPDQREPNLNPATKVQTFEDFMFEDKGAPALKYSGNVGQLGTRSAVRDAEGNITGYTFDEKRGDGEGGMSDYERRLLELEQAVAAATETPEVEEDQIINYRLMADGGRAGFAEGGMPYEGGIMDLESARQMYGLGKLVKKITRGVKKVVKSPLGKAAIGAALFKFGGGKGIMGKLFGLPGVDEFGGTPGFLSKFGLTSGFGSKIPTALGGIAASTLGSYFLTPKEEDDDEELYAGADIDDPRTIMNDPYKYINRRLVAEGGSIDEPVAKKTMPLLDMDGQEMDLRAEGGFVPLGRMERADDVPARLSKNEFVFTADAVRNAGEGDVDKGAEVMYNMMKNLESGGEVSEESQGLEGAREMFQTSQRLEEVI